MFDTYKSMFGAGFSNPIDNMVYDQMVLAEIEKDDKEIALREMYGDPATLDEEEVVPYD